MKVIKETQEVIVGYQAVDGTKFSTSEACLEYEKTAKAVIKGRFMNFVVKKVNTESWCDVPFVSTCDWSAGLVRLNSAEDVNQANMYFDLIHNNNQKFTDEMIGKDIIVGFDDCDEWAYLYGTIDDCVKMYKDRLMTLTVKDEKEN